MKKIYGAGYSLIELMIAISIIGILTILALSSFRHFTNTTHDQILQQQLLQAIRFARQEAITRGESVSLSIDGNSLLITLVNNKVIHSSSLQLNKGKLYWRSFPYYRKYLEFNADSLQESDNATFWYCPDKQSSPSWAIKVNQFGKAHVVSDSKNEKCSL